MRPLPDYLARLNARTLDVPNPGAFQVTVR
jgi:hypothetical protein